MGSQNIVGFVMESKGLCFLCLDKTSEIKPEPEGELPPIQTYSLQYLTRYLKMDLGKLFNDEGQSTAELLLLDNVEKPRLKVELCEDCVSLSKQFSELYQQLEILEMKMGSCLKLINGKLLSANGDVRKTEQLRKLIDFDDTLNSGEGSRAWTKMELLRTHTLERCTNKLKAVQSRIRIVNLTNEDIIAEKSKIKTNFSTYLNEHGISQSTTRTEGEEFDETWEIKPELPSPDFTLDNDHHPDDIDLHDDAMGEDIDTSDLKGEAITNSPKRIDMLACGLCPAEFRNIYKYNRHFESTHKGVKFTCKKCDKSFTRKDILRRHEQRNCNGKKSAERKTIPGNCKSRTRDRRHQYSINPDNGTYKCLICSTSEDFPSEVDFYSHYKLVHSSHRFLCEVCNRRFQWKESLTRHQQNTRCAKNLDTRTVAKRMADEVNRRNEALGKDSDGDKLAVAGPSKIVDSSAKSTGRKSSKGWKQRFSVNPDSGKYECLVCSKEYETEPDIQGHWKVIHEGEKFSCEVCKEQFTRTDNLRRHQYTAGCGKQLGLETRASKEEICHLCGKAFFSEFTLQQHMDGVHLKLRKFGCDLCDKKYNTNSELSKHKSTVHSKRVKKNTLICQHCGKTFSRRSKLQTHLDEVHMK